MGLPNLKEAVSYDGPAEAQGEHSHGGHEDPLPAPKDQAVPEDDLAKNRENAKVHEDGVGEGQWERHHLPLRGRAEPPAAGEEAHAKPDGRHAERDDDGAWDLDLIGF